MGNPWKCYSQPRNYLCEERRKSPQHSAAVSVDPNFQRLALGSFVLTFLNTVQLWEKSFLMTTLTTVRVLEKSRKRPPSMCANSERIYYLEKASCMLGPTILYKGKMVKLLRGTCELLLNTAKGEGSPKEVRSFSMPFWLKQMAIILVHSHWPGLVRDRSVLIWFSLWAVVAWAWPGLELRVSGLLLAVESVGDWLSFVHGSSSESACSVSGN